MSAGSASCVEQSSASSLMKPDSISHRQYRLPNPVTCLSLYNDGLLALSLSISHVNAGQPTACMQIAALDVLSLSFKAEERFRARVFTATKAAGDVLSNFALEAAPDSSFFFFVSIHLCRPVLSSY